MTEIIPLNHGNVLYIAQRMRAADREEIYATRWSDDPKELAADAMACPHMCFIATYNGEPVSAYGAIPMHPNVWSVWMFATDKWPKVALSTTKHIRRNVKTALIKSGATRCECRSHAGHTVAHKWLDTLGMVKESTLEKYGKNGEDFYLFKWHNNQ